MFKFLLFNILFSTLVAEPESDLGSINWVPISEVENLIDKNPRKVFIDIYADWCGWCKVMDRSTFKDTDVVSYLTENYYSVRIDADSEAIITFQGEKLTERAFVRSLGIQGLPTSILMNETLKKVKPMTGYQEAPEFLRAIVRFNK